MSSLQNESEHMPRIDSKRFTPQDRGPSPLGCCRGSPSPFPESRKIEEDGESKLVFTCLFDC